MSKINSLQKKLRQVIPGQQLYNAPIDCLAKGTDAGFYRLMPQLVVQVNNEAEIREVLRLCNELTTPVTFKAGGTSLSGQTISDSVLIEIGPDFNAITISDEGLVASFQPGVRGGFANQQLAKYGRKIGPSPASVNAAKIGGIVANNASGASYGIVTNSYNTLKSLRLVMADGTLLDTADAASRVAFESSHAALLHEIGVIRDQIKNDPALADKIKQKYHLKNTTGYGMNAFVDFNHPIDIIAHLMVGSEGTLGFISEVTLNTIADQARKTCSLLFMPNITEAARAILPLRQCQVSAAELMDRNALRAVEDVEGLPSLLKSLPDEAAALLIETSANTEAELIQQKNEIEVRLSAIQTLYPIQFTDNTKDYNTYWKVRKGLFTSAAATRPAGTTCIIEDVAFPGERLDASLPDLQRLLDQHHYHGSVMWGHLLDGNIHFLIMPDFSRPQEMENYKSFMHELADLVVNKYNGSLKAEHGTGRNMAPFVAYEWGQEIYQLMKSVKAAFDPKSILNPGVLINEDPEVYVKNIKPLPQAHPIVDACIECGFCESSCPSRDLTLSPRQRITVFRELSRVQGEPQSAVHKGIAKAYRYKGEESCATDGLCALNCPVGINTGLLIKALRFDGKGTVSKSIATYVSNHFGAFAAAARYALKGAYWAQRVLPQVVLKKGGYALHRLSGRTIPLWNKYLPQAAPAIDVDTKHAGKYKVVYFPACINRMFGNGPEYKEKEALTQVTSNLLQKAGYELIYPADLENLCCGMAFDSKGFKEQGMQKLKALEKALLEASNNGEYQVLCDMSPCLLRMKEWMDKRLKLYEPIGFTLTFLKDKLHFWQQPETVMVHSTCSSTKMGLDDQLVELAGLCAREVIRPEKTGCCGWAGDKGFNLPDLNKSALRYLKDEIPVQATGGYSTSRTCEIGLSHHSGLTYQSILFLVDRSTVALAEKTSNSDKYL